MRKLAIAAVVVCLVGVGASAQTDRQREAEEAVKKQQERSFDGLFEGLTVESKKFNLERHRSDRSWRPFGLTVDDFTASFEKIGLTADVLECEPDRSVKMMCIYRLGNYRFFNLLIVSFDDARRVSRVTLTLPGKTGVDAITYAVTALVGSDQARRVLDSLPKTDDRSVKRGRPPKDIYVEGSLSETAPSLFIHKN